jgi:hypothetical protein
MVDEPAGLRALEGRAAQTQPNLAIRDRPRPCCFVVRQPADLGETFLQWSECERHAARIGRLRSNRPHRRQEPGEHEIVAEISGAVKVVPEMNPHRSGLTERPLERERGADVAGAALINRERQVAQLPAVICDEGKVRGQCHSDTDPGTGEGHAPGIG